MQVLFVGFFAWLLIEALRQLKGVERAYFGCWLFASVVVALRDFLPPGWLSAIANIATIMEIVMIVAAAFILRDHISKEQKSEPASIAESE